MAHVVDPGDRIDYAAHDLPQRKGHRAEDRAIKAPRVEPGG